MEFKIFKTVKICLMIKTNFLARKFLYNSMRKGKDTEPDPFYEKKGRIRMRIWSDLEPNPCLWLTDPAADPRGPIHTDPEHWIKQCWEPQPDLVREDGDSGWGGLEAVAAGGGRTKGAEAGGASLLYGKAGHAAWRRTSRLLWLLFHYNQCCGSSLVSMQIRKRVQIQHFLPMRILYGSGSGSRSKVLMTNLQL